MAETPDAAVIDPQARSAIQRFGPMVAAAGLVLFAFRAAIAEAISRYAEPGGYYAHGYYVPLVSAWLVWRDRAALARVPTAPDARALPLLALVAAVHLAGMVLDIHFVGSSMLVAALFALVWAFAGWPLARALIFPIGFLAFAVPLPHFGILRLSFELKLLAAHLAAGLIDLAGIAVLQEGSILHFESQSLTVDYACSGLRTLIALVAFGALFAILERDSVLRALIFLALSVPIAVVANLVRVLLLVTIALTGHRDLLETWVHDATGLVTYAVALVCLLGVRAVMRGVAGGPAAEVASGAADGPASGSESGSGGSGPASKSGSGGSGPASEPAAPPPPPAARAGRGRPALALGGALVVLAALGGTSLRWPRAEGSPRSLVDLAARVPARLAGLEGEDLPVERFVYELLGADEILLRAYRATPRGADVLVYVVAASDARKVAHPPEQCFSGGGWRIDGFEKVEREIGPGLAIPAVRMEVSHGEARQLVYYWFVVGSLETADMVRHQLAVLFRGDATRGRVAMVRVSTMAPAGLEDAEARLTRVLAELVPSLREALR